MPDKVMPVRGNLTSQEVFRYACVDRAAKIVADGADDNETLIICLAVTEINTDAHLVAAVGNMEDTKEHLLRIRKGIECVPQDLIAMIAQAVLDPGITRLYSKFLSNIEGHAGFRFDIAEGERVWQYGALMTHFKRSYDATLLAVTRSHRFEADIIENPRWEFEVKSGMSLFYIAPERLKHISFPS
jgi:voltage-gated potassium channel